MGGVDDDEFVFNVAAGSDSVGLSVALARSADEGKNLVLRTIGGAALAAAVKAVCIANSDLVARGMVFHMFSFFGERISSPDGGSISPLCLRLELCSVRPSRGR